MFIRFDVIHERDGQTDGQTDRHCMTAKAALASHRAVKIAVFTYRSLHFGFPWRRPCDYHAMCCTDGKTVQCLSNPSQHVPIYLQWFPSYTMLKSKNRYFYHIFVSSGDAPDAITLTVVWMEREFDAYKLSRCICLSSYNRF